MEKTRLEDQHRLRPYKDRTQGEPGALGHHARSRAGSYLTESVAPPPPPAVLREAPECESQFDAALSNSV